MMPEPSGQFQFQKGPSSAPARVQHRETRFSRAQGIAASTRRARASHPLCPISTEAIDVGDRGLATTTPSTVIGISLGAQPKAWRVARSRGTLKVDNAAKPEETMKAFLRLLALSAAAFALLAPVGPTRAQLLITGNDEKISFDENTGKTITHPPGKDTVSIIDIADPAKPKIVVNLPLMNTITGPPVNLAITPDQHLALVANSLDWGKDGDAWKGVPDNRIYVIDLTASPPVQIGTVEAGKQPSGMAINRAGTLALVANRADDTVSVLSIDGKTVKIVDTVSVASPAPTSGAQKAPPALPSAVDR